MPTMTETLRRAIRQYHSRYRLAKDCGLQPSALSRFMSGKTSLTLTSLEALAPWLGLRLVVDGPEGKRVRTAPRRRGGQ